MIEFLKISSDGGAQMNQRQAYRTFVSYIDRSREYYGAQGYTRPYTWAHYREVPFSPLRKPLSGCRVGLVTTAGRKDRTAQSGVTAPGALCHGGRSCSDPSVHRISFLG